MIKPIKIQVRFSDIDAMGHVNNAIYLNYFESARMEYFKQLVGADWDWKNDGVILLKNEIEYVKPVLLQHTPEISIDVLKIGNKSFELGYKLMVDDVVFTKGKSTLVCFNYIKQGTIDIPTSLRSHLSKLIVE